MQPVNPQMTLFPMSGIPGVINHWHFKPQLPGTDTYKSSFPQTVRDWNSLADSLMCAEDLVAKFTSLVRARN